MCLLCLLSKGVLQKVRGGGRYLLPSLKLHQQPLVTGGSVREEQFAGREWHEGGVGTVPALLPLPWGDSHTHG